MKTKLAITTILLVAFQYNFAQDVKTDTVIDSAQIKMIALEKARVDEKERLKSELKEQKKALKEQEKIEDKAKDEKNALEKEKDNLKDEQRKVEKEQREIERKKDKLDNAKKLVEKRTEKLADNNKDLVKMHERFDKLKSKGKLSPVEIEEWNVKITKQQLKIKETEEDIFKAQEKLNKL